MKIYSVDPNGNFVRRRKTAGAKGKKRGKFGICFNLNQEGTVLNVEVVAEKGTHYSGLIETGIIKKYFMITQLLGKATNISQGTAIEEVGWGGNPPPITESSQPPPPPPPPPQGVLSTEEKKKQQIDFGTSPTTQRQIV